MKFTQLFTKTLRDAPSDEEALNAQLLIRAGFVSKNSAGVYSFMPLGWNVIDKINKIIREEMDAISGQEIFMPALVDKKYWQATGRWDVDIGYEAKNRKDKEPSFVLGWSHEDILTAMAAKYIESYHDLPRYVYQIQTKFRDEPRSKSGLLRGKEFLMKDLYSFNASNEGFIEYYERAKVAYHKIFKRCGVDAIYTRAAGGVFTQSDTHEFQVISDVGEDTIYVCSKCQYAENKEVTEFKSGDKCTQCDGEIEEKKSIEVGNIFPLGDKYSKALGLEFTDEKGVKKPVIMGSYGIGISRLMGTVVEVHNDENGIKWPENLTPYKYHLIALDGAKAEGDKIYEKLKGDVLYDDRDDKMAGEKFADADLIGISTRLVVSKKTLKENSVEVKKRYEKESKLVPINNFI
jgi:prolyl-tRNA synthetase